LRSAYLDRNAGTHQRRGFVGGEIVGHECDRFGGDDDVSDVPPRSGCCESSELAVINRRGGRGRKVEAMTAVPANDRPAGRRFIWVTRHRRYRCVGNFRGGNSGDCRPGKTVFLTIVSLWQTPQASTLMSTWPRAGRRSGAFDDLGNLDRGLADLTAFMGESSVRSFARVEITKTA